VTNEEPSRGGSYVRNPDGSLTLMECTAPAEPRDKRATAEGATQPKTQAVTVELGAAAPAAPAVVPAAQE